jgi:serine/threonine protein kinase
MPPKPTFHTLNDKDALGAVPRQPVGNTNADHGGQETASRSAPATGPMLLTVGARPLPEYELVGLLGRGGYGEVWKALGPRGFPVALKFVRMQDQAGSSELRSLDLMRGIRHAHLLPLFGAWQRDDYLIIAMELADRTLQDRWKECREQGLLGMPADELWEAMRDAARGIDYLNEHHSPGSKGGIQHKDVKPQNLLLVGGSVKVADFGLARLLENTITNVTANMTPAFAAPEFLSGKATRWSDQYSLAASYVYLLSGHLPFAGSSAEVLMGHLAQPPNLDGLPGKERPIVARALAKKPEERWPSCVARGRPACSGRLAEARGKARPLHR